FPARSSFYVIDNPFPQAIGEIPDLAGQGIVGTPLVKTVSISETVPFPVSSMYMMRVQPDNSFYILAEDQGTGGSSWLFNGQQQILHYSADGKLIERTRVPLRGP